MSDRRVRVLIGATGCTQDLDGHVAELVALLACTSVSVRTVRLLLFLVTHDTRLDALKHGRLEVDFSRGKFHPYLRETLPRVDFEETDDVA